MRCWRCCWSLSCPALHAALAVCSCTACSARCPVLRCTHVFTHPIFFSSFKGHLEPKMSVRLPSLTIYIQSSYCNSHLACPPFHALLSLRNINPLLMGASPPSSPRYWNVPAANKQKHPSITSLPLWFDHLESIRDKAGSLLPAGGQPSNAAAM